MMDGTGAGSAPAEPVDDESSGERVEKRAVLLPAAQFECNALMTWQLPKAFANAASTCRVS